MFTNEQQTWWTYILRTLTVATLYFAIARLALLLAFPGSNATPVWPPSGIAVGLVVLQRRFLKPFHAAFAADFLNLHLPN